MNGSSRQLAFDFVPPEEPTLENFVAGSNAEVLMQLGALARGEQAERFVYLWGTPSSGRTHLLHAVVAALKDSGMSAEYFPTDEAILAAADRTLDAAAVDDVHNLSRAGQAALFGIINRLRECGGVLVAAGDVPPTRLRLREDITTRLAWGLVHEVQPLSDEQKADALRERAARRGFALSDEVLRYLLNHSQRDLRTLVAVVETLDRYSMETKRPVSVPLARELLATR